MRPDTVDVAAVPPPAEVGGGLVVDDVSVRYGDAVALDGVSLRVAPGEIVALVGANGAGKSSLLAAVSGLVPATGRIVAGGTDLSGLGVEERARHVIHVPEGRRLFTRLSVSANLVLGGFTRSADDRARRRREVEEIFPPLAVLGARRAGLLSGGEQQMVALGRGLMGTGRILAIDELSLGLAPAAATAFVSSLTTLREQGYAILLVEQYLSLALTVADRVVLLSRGRVVLDSPAALLRAQGSAVTEAYLDQVVVAADADEGDGPARARDDAGTSTDVRAARGPSPRPALVGGALLAVSPFLPWFHAEDATGERILLGWQTPEWIPVLMTLGGLVGLATAALWRRGRLSPPVAALALLTGLAALGAVVARTWLFGYGLAGFTDTDYQRLWGLFVALNAAPLCLVGVAMLAVPVLRAGLGRS
jgi:branched-chain amino acid transport system ATP-binding protein